MPDWFITAGLVVGIFICAGLCWGHWELAGQTAHLKMHRLHLIRLVGLAFFVAALGLARLI